MRSYNSKGKIFVISGPSGAGKSTVIDRVMRGRKDLAFSVSATTRHPRAGETDGVNYFFVNTSRFAAMIESGELLEYAQYAGNFYGTPKAAVMDLLEKGISVILDIEVQGALQVKSKLPEAVLVFLTPPSFAELERRLHGRKQDSEDKIRDRLEIARKELKYIDNYDYLVINDDVDSAADDIKAIITAEKCKTADRLNIIELL